MHQTRPTHCVISPAYQRSADTIESILDKLLFMHILWITFSVRAHDLEQFLDAVYTLLTITTGAHHGQGHMNTAGSFFEMAFEQYALFANCRLASASPCQTASGRRGAHCKCEVTRCIMHGDDHRSRLQKTSGILAPGSQFVVLELLDRYTVD